MSGWIAGSTVAASVIGAYGANKAAGTQANAANNAAALQKQQFDQQMALQEPYRQAGLTGQNRLMELMGLGGDTGAAGYGKYAKDFSAADYQQDPGYQFRLGEGLKQLSHAAGARGGLISGQTMKGMEDYAQNSASNEYQNAFNRYQTNRSNQLQPLGNLMTSGQSAASNQAGQAGQYGVNAGNMMVQAGQANAAGQIGMANSLASGLSSGASAYQNQNNFNNWLTKQPGGAGAGVTAGNAGYGNYNQIPAGYTYPG
jgi:hypothetical protein